MAEDSPLLQRIKLGRVLSRYREQAGITPSQVRDRMRWSARKLSQAESGKVILNYPELKELCDLYGVDGQQREDLFELGIAARKRGSYGNVRMDVRAYIAMEASAARLRIYYGDLVPGLLQTEDYMRALFAGVGLITDQKEVDRLVEGRLVRRGVLDTIGRYDLVLGEATLRQNVGGPAVMAEQLSQLLRAAARPNVSIRLLPQGIGAHPGLGLNFQILDLREPEKTLVWIESLSSSHYLERDDGVKRHIVAFDLLQSKALSEDDSRQELQRSIEKINKEVP